MLAGLRHAGRPDPAGALVEHPIRRTVRAPGSSRSCPVADRCADRWLGLVPARSARSWSEYPLRCDNYAGTVSTNAWEQGPSVAPHQAVCARPSLGAVSVYLDHAASTPMRPEAVAAMLPFLAEHPGEPVGLARGVARDRRPRSKRRARSSPRRAARAPHEIVFTGGGSEGDNLAVKGAAWAARPRSAARRRRDDRHRAQGRARRAARASNARDSASRASAPRSTASSTSTRSRPRSTSAPRSSR